MDAESKMDATVLQGCFENGVSLRTKNEYMYIYIYVKRFSVYGS